MSKHEVFRSVTIKVSISGTDKTMIVESHFWHDLLERGVTVVFMHDGRPHVSDPVENNRKHSVARLVMKCGAGFTAHPKNRDDPFNLTPDNLEVVKDGRAKYAALISIKPVNREGFIDPDWIDPNVGYGDDSEVHEDIREVLPSAPLDPVETDRRLGEDDLKVVIKDGHGLKGGLRSSKRVNTSHDVDKDVSVPDTQKAQLQKLYDDMARRNGAIIPTKGPKFKPFSPGWFNAGKEYKS